MTMQQPSPALTNPVANVLYVAPTGDDENDGFSWGSAKRTILAAYDALPSGFWNVEKGGEGGDVGQADVQLGQQPRQVGGIPGEVGGERVQGTVPHMRLQRFAEGQIRGHARGIVGMPDEHVPAVALRALGELGQQPGLANARLTSDEHDPALTPAGCIQPRE